MAMRITINIFFSPYLFCWKINSNFQMSENLRDNEI